MKAADVARVRLAHQLVAKPLARPVDVVRRMGAMQGQDFPGTKWAVALRTRRATEREVDAAFERREIVRIWAMRGTLQFVAAEDAAWMVELFGERAIRGAAGRHRQLGLDAETFARADGILAEAAREGPVGRRALVATLDAAGISPKGQRGIHMIQHASLRGHLVQVGFERHEALFLVSAKALPRATRLTRAEALDEVARRYFATRGPATLRDLVWWTGLTLTDAKAAIARLADELQAADVGGAPSWWSGDTRPARGGRVDLLPGFDEMLLAYADRSASMGARVAKLWWPGGGAFRPPVLVDGVARGVWAARRGKDGVRVEVTRAGAISAPGLARAKARLARYHASAAPRTSR